MADEEPVSNANPSPNPNPNPEEADEDSDDDDLDSYKSSDSESDSDGEIEDNSSNLLSKGINPPEEFEEPENVPVETTTFSPQEFVEETIEALNHPPLRKRHAESELRFLNRKGPWDFPEDPENWDEKDLQELWTDGSPLDTKTGWDPDWAGPNEWAAVAIEAEHGLNPPRIAPFYVPYRRPSPVLPRAIPYLRAPLSLLEELDRIEEVLKWVSYIFPNGSSYEGTVWDDLAHGKGVLVNKNGLVRYEGEWFQNDLEGHGVLEVDIPDIEPVPGSKLEEEMRAEGKIISMDYIPPEDKEWLKKDIEDSFDLAGRRREIPFYENNEWIKQFGKKPEKGRYRYAGQWKHGRMHGCGVYEVNERTRYGRFYFGELLEDPHGCDEKISDMHSAIAEVAAAKARMFVNKPDGMVREKHGPYGDPQHAYFYEGEDVWMAPGFINQFHEVPEYWKRYVAEVDTEREMWLNSFYRAPLRLPMPAELEHWWQKDPVPEFILVNKEIDPELEDPSDPQQDEPIIVHTPSGRIINFIEDEEHGVRLFWQPKLKPGEEVDPDKVAFLPLGFDDFYGAEEEEEKKKKNTFLDKAGKALQTVFDRLDKWVEDAKRDSDRKIKEMERKLEIVDAEIRLDEEYAEMDLELKEMEEEEERKEKEAPKEATDKETVPEEKVVAEEAEIEDDDEGEGDDDEEDEEEDEAAASSFGTVRSDDGSSFSKNGPGKSTPKEPPFSALSLGFASCSLISAVSSRMHQSLTSVRKKSFKPTPPSCPTVLPRSVEVICYPPQTLPKNGSLRAVRQEIHQLHAKKTSKGSGSSSQLRSLSRILLPCSVQTKARTDAKPSELDDRDLGSILSLHNQVNVPEWCTVS